MQEQQPSRQLTSRVFLDRRSLQKFSGKRGGMSCLQDNRRQDSDQADSQQYTVLSVLLQAA